MTTKTPELAHEYHETTKHHPRRYARAPGYMDWATQPDPFRRYHGFPTVPLLLREAAGPPCYDDLYTPGAVPAQSVCQSSISAFFQFSMALSAWKEYRGTRWALRINPSSGNLHPTEAYLIAGPIAGLLDTPAVLHYAPKDHVLERRTDIRPEVWGHLSGAFPKNTFFVGLSSIHWREAWKYGERAYRYCQHDVGHALGALGLAAALHGWSAHPVVGMSDDAVSTLLGLDRDADYEQAEREHPDLVIAVVPDRTTTGDNLPNDLTDDAVTSIQCGSWYGSANRLSPKHTEWELIDAVATHCSKPATTAPENSTRPAAFATPIDAKRAACSARTVIQQRRSAVAMDGQTRLTAEQFYLMMDRVLPRFDLPPWRALGPPVFAHLGLFVHLVDDLTPGLYFLVRSPDELTKLQEAMRSEFEWSKPETCPPHLPLYRLREADTREVAGIVSCGQDIAANGAFSAGVICAFDEPLMTHGSWVYRRLFWETGVIGQVLYLEAEAAGVRATGIGCFFDDLVHDVFGLTDGRYQSLYHFTVGGAVEDTRLTTLPPYSGARISGATP